MKIRAVSKKEFDRTMASQNINDDNVEELLTDTWLVSINPSDEVMRVAYANSPELQPLFKKDHPRVFRLFFDDVKVETEIILIGGGGTVMARPMSEDQARDTFNYLGTVPKDATLLIHCTAGKSRSVAVAHFAAELAGQDPKGIYENDEQVPNETCLRLLRQHGKKIN